MGDINTIDLRSSGTVGGVRIISLNGSSSPSPTPPAPADYPFEFGEGENSAVQKGVDNSATGISSVAMGYTTAATNDYAFTEGKGTTASGEASHAEGGYTIASNYCEHAQGQYNVSNKASDSFGNAGNTIHSIGIGTADDACANAVEVMQNGDVYIKGIGSYDGTNPSSAVPVNEILTGVNKIVVLTQQQYDGITPDANTLYIIK